MNYDKQNSNDIIDYSINNIISGNILIRPINDDLIEKMLDSNIIKIIKNKDKTITKVHVNKNNDHVTLYATIENFNILKYGIDETIISTMDKAVQIAIAAGLEVLKDSGIIINNGKNDWTLPLEMQNKTGIIYVTSFPALDSTIQEVSRYYNAKSLSKLNINNIITELKNRIKKKTGELSHESEIAFDKIENIFSELEVNEEKYEFDRKFLFKIFLLANAQLAQIIKAKGPNLQTNSACTGTTQGLSIAYDMIQTNKADRIIVIASDIASSDTLMPWIGNGFHVLGATCTKSNINEACLPFGENRSGMILSSGAIGIIVESKKAAKLRYKLYLSNFKLNNLNNIIKKPFKCHILGTLISNSAYHGTSLDKNAIAYEMEKFIFNIEQKYNISRKEIANNGIYLSHETSTNTTVSSSCAYNEIYALRYVFGDELKNLLILNTKGFTGHAMSVSFEDIVAVEVLENKKVPPIANFISIDPNLGNDLKMSKGGYYPCKYALKFSAGFGSQIAFVLYSS
jgi:3-oxoacyl-(acyl-carrier-protein) synthase